MWRSCASSALVACLAALAGSTVALPQPTAPAGGEFQVNLTTASVQAFGAVALNADGFFVVAWESAGQDDAYGWGIFARRFDYLGIGQGIEFQVNSYTSFNQRSPAVAIDGAGNFVIAWRSSGQDGDVDGIFARRFDSAGVAQGAEFQVNSSTTNSQRSPAVAMSPAGNFVVVWDGVVDFSANYDVFARRFNAAGVAQAAELRVNFHTADAQLFPAVAINATGGFVVAWDSTDQDGSNTGVFARRFDAAGVAQGADFQAASYTVGYQGNAAVAMEPDGRFVIAWTSGQDGDSGGIFARRFDAAGAGLGPEFQVNLYTAGGQARPAVGMDTAGDFVVVWQSYGQDGSEMGVFGRLFDAGGVGETGEFQVNSYTSDAQGPFGPAVAMSGDGDFVVAWESYYQEGVGAGVFAQRYQTLAILDIDGDGTLGALTDGLLLLRHLFGFNGATLVTGAVDLAGCSRCDATSVEGYLADTSAASSRDTTPVGSEFQINSYTPSKQILPSVAMNDDGFLVVAWESYGQDQNGYGIFARRFDFPWFALGAEFQVNSHTLVHQRLPVTAMDNAGNFVVAWNSVLQDGSGEGVFARRYSDVALGTEFQVNSHTVGEQRYPAITVNDDFDFVVVWQSSNQDGSSWGIFARRFDIGGVGQGVEFQVNSYTLNDQLHSAVAIDVDGDFVVAWDSPQDGSSYGIFARRFDSAGMSQGVEFQVNAYTLGFQVIPAVAMDQDGDFVVTWMSENQDGSMSGIFARRFDAAGVAKGVELQVNSFTSGYQGRALVAMDDDGDFVVAWRSSEQDGWGSGVFARRFDADGTPLATEFQANSYTPGGQAVSGVAMSGDGDFVVTWWSQYQDGSNYGAFGQRYQALTLFDIDGNGSLGPLTDGLLVLRYLFGFTGPTLTAGAVAAGCSRCDFTAIEGYLQTLI